MQKILSYIFHVSQARRFLNFISLNKLIYPFLLKIKFNHSIRSGRTPLIVYQMGKVGSSTIVNSLYSLNLKNSFYHVHFISKKGLRFMEKIQKNNYGRWNKFPEHTKKHILSSYFLNKQITKDKLKNKKHKVITLIRDPISTNISGFFHNYYSFMPELKNRKKTLDLKDIEERFFKNYFHDVPLTWFDSEMKEIFDIDVFESDFPKTKGYKIYKGKHADLLLLKLEKINECAPEAFKKFLNIADFQIMNSNSAKNYIYYDIYKDFIKSINIPNSYMDKMYNSKFCKHFYSAEEIEQFRKKWSKE